MYSSIKIYRWLVECSSRDVVGEVSCALMKHILKQSKYWKHITIRQEAVWKPGFLRSSTVDTRKECNEWDGPRPIDNGKFSFACFTCAWPKEEKKVLLCPGQNLQIKKSVFEEYFCTKLCSSKRNQYLNRMVPKEFLQFMILFLLLKSSRQTFD